MAKAHANAKLSHDMVTRLGARPLSVERWAQDDSTVEIIRVTEQLAVMASRGPGHPAAVPFYAEFAPLTVVNAGSIVFWDLGSLTSTELSVVRTCLGIGKANLHNIAAVHMFYDSPLIGMAITVANVALDGLLSLYRDPEPFVEAFLETARDTGLAREPAPEPVAP